MTRFLLAAILCALAAGCDTEEVIELRGDVPDARSYDAVPPDATPPRCVCLHACTDSRDCLGLAPEICDTVAEVCQEDAPLTECASSDACTGGRACVKEDDPATGCP